jgi:hypothetical protein
MHDASFLPRASASVRIESPYANTLACQPWHHGVQQYHLGPLPYRAGSLDAWRVE